MKQHNKDTVKLVKDTKPECERDVTQLFELIEHLETKGVSFDIGSLSIKI